jgi:hypothetical protein
MGRCCRDSRLSTEKRGSETYGPIRARHHAPAEGIAQAASENVRCVDPRGFASELAPRSPVVSTDLSTQWRSQDAIDNTIALQARYEGAFAALSATDQLGHRLLQRIGSISTAARVDDLVGMALLRRSVTVFAATRHLLASSLVEPAKLAARSLFELLLATRYLVHGGAQSVPLERRTDPRRRETRARYYFVAAERNKIYKRQMMLDGKSNSPAIGKTDRRRIRAELAVTEQRLRANYPVQWRRFGDLGFRLPKPCYRDRSKWYAFGFRKPRVSSVRALAKRFGWLWEYEWLYSSWSSFLHAESITHDIGIEDGTVNVYSPYLADAAFGSLCVWSVAWQTMTCGFLAKAYQPTSMDDVRHVHLKTNELLTGLELGTLDAFF